MRGKRGRECVQRERTYKRKGERGVCEREMKKVCVCVFV